MEEKITIPKTIEEAIQFLDKELSEDDKKYIVKHGAISVHHSLGRWIRNNWGFWEEDKNDIVKCLVDMGFTHPDYMSTYIIEMFVKYITKN